MSTTTAFTLSVATGLHLLYFGLLILLITMFLLYIFYPIKKKDRIIDI